MKLVSLERRTTTGLGLRVTIETIDLETHSRLGARHADREPAFTEIAREALDRAAPAADALADDFQLA